MTSAEQDLQGALARANDRLMFARRTFERAAADFASGTPIPSRTLRKLKDDAERAEIDARHARHALEMVMDEQRRVLGMGI